jgi:hypothetical protein
MTDLPPQARKAHILPGLVHNSLISVGQLCDNEYSVTFTQNQVTVSKCDVRIPRSEITLVASQFETEM